MNRKDRLLVLFQHIYTLIKINFSYRNIFNIIFHLFKFTLAFIKIICYVVIPSIIHRIAEFYLYRTLYVAYMCYQHIPGYINFELELGISDELMYWFFMNYNDGHRLFIFWVFNGFPSFIKSDWLAVSFVFFFTWCKFVMINLLVYIFFSDFIWEGYWWWAKKFSVVLFIFCFFFILFAFGVTFTCDNWWWILKANCWYVRSFKFTKPITEEPSDYFTYG